MSDIVKHDFMLTNQRECSKAYLFRFLSVLSLLS